MLYSICRLVVSNQSLYYLVCSIGLPSEIIYTNTKIAKSAHHLMFEELTSSVLIHCIPSVYHYRAPL